MFAKINLDWTNGFFDWLFPLITDLHKNPLSYFAIIPVLLFWLWKQRLDAFRWILVTLLAVGVSDLCPYRLIKVNVERVRPNKAGIEFKLRTDDHSGSSFPSNHAANSFTAA